MLSSKSDRNSPFRRERHTFHGSFQVSVKRGIFINSALFSAFHLSKQVGSTSEVLRSSGCRVADPRFSLSTEKTKVSILHKLLVCSVFVGCSIYGGKLITVFVV